MCRLERVAGCGIIAPRRRNSAHLHRPWRANLRQSTISLPTGAPFPRDCFRKAITRSGWAVRMPGVRLARVEVKVMFGRLAASIEVADQWRTRRLAEI